jgi:hypothetical protein
MAVVLMLAGAEAGAQNMVNPSKPGDVFIDNYRSTVQLTECRGSGPTTECRVRVLQQGPGGPTYGSVWWTLDNLRDSERVAVRQGIAPYSGPAVPLVGAGPAAASTPRTAAAPVAAASAAGSATRPAGPAQQAPGRQAGTGQAAQPATAPQATAAGGRCTPATPYTRKVSASRAPSADLFKEIIANKFTVDGTDQYPRKVEFQSFSVSAPITNTVGMTNQGANRITNGAPAGAQLFPVKTSFTVCKAEWTKGGQYDSTYFCWRTGDEWACGVSESRVN